MMTREDAITWLNRRGLFAFAMDAFSPDAFFVSSSERTDETGTTWLQGGLVVVYPALGSWTLAPLPEMGVGPVFEPISYQTLEEAVMAASEWVGANGRGPNEEAGGKAGQVRY